jgi:DNA end-binding protein Ku
MASTVWKGYLTFGLLSVPIRLFAAARSERVSFNQLHKECNSRIRQSVYCPACDRKVEREEIVKGYEYEKDRYVLVDDEDLEKIAPESARTMEIQEFVKAQEIPPLFFDASYYVVPEQAGRKAYDLLLETMRDSGYAALAKVAMHQREYLVVMQPYGNGLTLHTMYYADEVRQVAEYGQPSGAEVKPQEVELAKRLVESLAAPFDPSKYRDEYQRRVREMVESKRQGMEVTSAPAPRLAPVVDLMDALQKSLAAMPRKPVKPAAEVRAIDGATVSPSQRKRGAKRVSA